MNFLTTTTERSPSQRRAGERDAAIRYAIGRCWLGRVLVASSAEGVCAILIGDDPDALARDLAKRFPTARPVRGGGKADSFLAEVVAFLAAPGRGLDVRLDPRGTSFQQIVWRALSEIPVGSTATYTEVAARIGRPGAVRAVAAACAANPIAIAIPCHRVVRADGGLAGYRWGVERKRALLDREAAA